MSEARPKIQLKSIHDQAREIQRNEGNQESQETDVFDDNILKMIQKENDIIYNDDYEYFQFYGKKRLAVENWVEANKEDSKRYQKLKSRLVVTQNDKQPKVLLERDEEVHEDLRELKEVRALVSFSIKRKIPEGADEEGVDKVEKKLKHQLVDYSSTESEDDDNHH